MIKVKGTAIVDVKYEVVLNMSKAQFEALGGFNKSQALVAKINSRTITEIGEINELEIDETVEVEEEK